jgi:nucleoside-diphosphate-sugar epimerase
MLSHINVGSGEDHSITDLAKLIAKVIGYKGGIVTDPSKPDGTPRKLMDSARLNRLGWTSSIGLQEGLGSAYEDFLRQIEP